MSKEHERVVLKVPVSAEGLEAGDVGTVVHVYKDGEAYEVEFITLDGNCRSSHTGSRASATGRPTRDHTRARTHGKVGEAQRCG